MEWRTLRSPSLEIQPPYWAEQPSKITRERLSVPKLRIVPPLLATALPLNNLRPLKLRVTPVGIRNMRLLWLAEMLTGFVLDPVMVRFLSINNSTPANVTKVAAGEKLMVPPNSVSAIALRKLPAPLSLPLVTVVRHRPPSTAPMSGLPPTGIGRVTPRWSVARTLFGSPPFTAGLGGPS